MNLTNLALRAALWSYVGSGLRVFLQLVAQIVLARLVGPEAFGVFALSFLIVGFLSLVVEMGLGAALLQKKTINSDLIYAVLNRTVFVGFSMTVLILSAAHFIANIVAEPNLAPVLRGMAPMIMISGLSVVPFALLRRNLELKQFQISQLGGYLIGYPLVGISLALIGSDVWALVAAALSHSIVTFLLALWFSRFKLKFGKNFSTRPLLSFGKNVLMTNVFNWCVENLDKLLVGRIFGASALGLYSVSYNFVRTPTNHLVISLQATLFPASSRAQDNLPGIQRGYLAAIAVVTLATIPTFCGVAIASDTMVISLFGEQWKEAARLLPPLALAMVFHAIMAVAGPVLFGIGRPHLEKRIQGWTALCFLLVIIYLSRYSVQVLAWGVFGVYFSRAIWMTYVVLFEIGVESARFFRAIRGSIILSCLVTLIVALADRLISETLPVQLRLCIVVSSAFLFAFSLFWLNPAFYIGEELRSIILNLLKTQPRLSRFRFLHRLSGS